MLIKLQEQPPRPTKSFPIAKFPFPSFNPVQSSILEVYDKEANCIISAATSAGKTVCAEMYLSYEVRKRGGKGIYLSPLKALSQEKIDDWLDEEYHFKDLKVCICTGDYKLTPEKIKEINKSDIIILTSEMLNSRSRNHKAETNAWLREVGTIIIDEAHLLTVAGRGDHLESGIMKFTEMNPDARLVLLSATMPNVNEIGEWISHLTNRDTYLIESSYRPCPLQIHYERYEQGGRYDDNEDEKVASALRLVRKHKEDKFLLFVHTKRTGEKMRRALEDNGFACEYHNANLEKYKRVAIEKQFKEDEKLRCIVATSTLAWGCNLPSRRVVVLGVHRGLSEVENYDILQMVGRAGRPQYDPRGDAHILLPSRDFGKYLLKLKTPQSIRSQMVDIKVLAFHIVSEIHHGNIKTLEDVYDWYSRSLANFQKTELKEDIVKCVITGLLRSGTIKADEENLSVTSTGIVASMFYYSPYDVADLYNNFTKVFEKNNEDRNLWVSMALANTDSQRVNICNRVEKAEMEDFERAVSGGSLEKVLTNNKKFTDGALKAGFCYNNLLNGDTGTFDSMNSLIRNLQMDFERMGEVLQTLDSIGNKWDRKEWINRLKMRMRYGVDDDLVDLCRLTGIGKAKAKRLWAANIRTLEAISKDTEGVMKALNCSGKKAEEVCEEAREIIKNCGDTSPNILDQKQ